MTTLERIFNASDDYLTNYLKEIDPKVNIYNLNQKRYMVAYYLNTSKQLVRDEYTSDPRFSDALIKANTYQEFKNLLTTTKYNTLNQSAEYFKFYLLIECDNFRGSFDFGALFSDLDNVNMPNVNRYILSGDHDNDLSMHSMQVENGMIKINLNEIDDDSDDNIYNEITIPVSIFVDTIEKMIAAYSTYKTKRH